MILSNVGIRKALESGQIVIDPAPAKDQYDTSSLNLRLGHQFKRYNQELIEQRGIDTTVDPDLFDYKYMSNTYMNVVSVSQGNSIIIKPEEFMLATTLERIHLPEESQIAARIEGRSRIARIGLSVHLTAPTVHLGFQGQLALELRNHGKFNIRLTPGIRICQLIFERVGEPASRETDPYFQGQELP